MNNMKGIKMKIDEAEVSTILQIGDDELYRATRYKVPLSFVLLKTKESFDDIIAHTRRSDITQQITTDIMCVYLTHTDHSEAASFLKN